MQDEFRAIDLLRNSSHPNIVEVIEHGELEYMSRYFIDMELCDLNLQCYIYGDWNPVVLQEMPYFTGDLPPKMKAAQIWSMMRDVTNGLIHIHSLDQVHRDIKPQNSKPPLSGIGPSPRVVLYSRRIDAWKIADFGFACRGDSQTAQHSLRARGSPGYRAPELVRPEVPTYTNKVDIWALGCVFYETMFQMKAFSDDFAVRQYSYPEGNLRMPRESSYFGVGTPSLMLMMSKMLDKDPRCRPSARNICEQLNSFHIGGPPIGTCNSS